MGPHFFSFIEFPSQFSTFTRSLASIDCQNVGATARRNPACDSAGDHRTQAMAHTEGAHFDHSLVVISWIAPELGVSRVRGGLDALYPPLRAMVFTPSGEQRRQAPYRSTEAFDLRGGLIKPNSCRAGALDPCFVGGEEWPKRVEQSSQQLLNRSTIRDIDSAERVNPIVAQQKSRLSFHLSWTGPPLEQKTTMSMGLAWRTIASKEQGTRSGPTPRHQMACMPMRNKARCQVCLHL